MRDTIISRHWMPDRTGTEIVLGISRCTSNKHDEPTATKQALQGQACLMFANMSSEPGLKSQPKQADVPETAADVLLSD